MYLYIFAVVPVDSAQPTAEQVVQWILEHPDQCPALLGGSSSQARSNDFDADSDSDSASTDTVEGGSSANESSVCILPNNLCLWFNEICFTISNRTNTLCGQTLKRPICTQCTLEGWSYLE